MSLKTRLTSLVTAIASKAEALKAWTVTELDDVYSTIQGVVDAIPTNTSELDNDTGYITGISNLTEITTRSYNDLQDLPILNNSQWDTAYGWGNHANEGYITGISNLTEITTRSYNDLQDRPTLNISSWNEAYAWGDHSLEGYLTSFTETDPIFTNSAAYGITLGNITDWNTSFGWGDHSTEGYLTSFTETDPIFTNSAAYGILSSHITNWNAAYTWGDHSLEGYLTSISVSDTNTNTTKHEIATVEGGSVKETVTALVTPFLDGNELVLKFNNENGVEQSVSVDLSSLNLTDVYAGDMTFNAATNVITVTLNDGVTEYDINLSEFSIVTNTDAFGVTTLAQEATTKLTVSKVGQSGEYADLLNPPTIPTQTSDLTNNSNYVTGQNGITGLWKGTQTEYDNLTPDANTVYYIL